MRARQFIHAAAFGAVFIVAYAWFVPPKSPSMFGTNNAVRFYLAKALALDGAFSIERYYRGGIDAALFEGHFYSGKAPAASFLAVPVIRLVSIAAADRLVPDWVYLYLSRLFVISIPSAAMVFSLHAFFLRLGVPDRRTDLLCIGYGLGTMAFPYSTEFVGHQLAAVFLLWCFLCLAASRKAASVLHGRARIRTYASLFAAGLFAGLAVAADYQTALIVAILFCFLGPPLRSLAALGAFVAGCLPGAAMVLGYNYACFGNAFSFPYAHEAMPIAREVQGRGLFGVMTPRGVPLVKLLFSPWRGIFFGSPFLLLSLPGLQALRRGDAADTAGIGGGRLAALCLCVGGGYLLFNSSYGAWSGGAGYGPRFLVPAIPFLVIPVAALVSRGGRGAVVLLAVLVAYSVAFHSIGTASGPLAHEYLRNPMREFLLPSLLRGNVRPNWGAEAGMPGAAGLAPLLALVAGCAVLALATAARGGRGRADSGDRLLLALCAAGALAMAMLFVLHRTEETAYRYGVLGHSYDVAGDPDAALPLFEKSLEMDPRDARVTRELLRLLVWKGDYRRAFEVSARAAALRPGDRALTEYTTALARIRAIDAVLAAHPDDPNLRAERDALLHFLGVLDGAETAVKR